MLLTALLGGSFSALRAQGGDIGGGDTPPTVTLSAASQSLTGTAATASLTVTIEACDDQLMGTPGPVLTMTGGSVTSVAATSGSVAGCTYSRRWTATLSLTPGTNTLQAQVCDDASPSQCTTATGSYTYTRHAVSVTPDGQAFTATVGQSRSQTFTVQNLGNTTQTFAVSRTCSGTGVNGCTSPPSPSSLTIAAGASGSTTVSYTAGAAGTSGSVNVTATQNGYAAATDGGSINVSVPYVYGVTVTPVGGTSVSAGALESKTQSFTVKNTGNASATFGVAASCTGMSACNPSTTSVTLAAGASTSVGIGYTTGQGGTSGTVKLTATQSNHTSTTANGTVNVSVARTYGVAVTPDGTVVSATALQTKTQSFTVRNDGNASATFELQVSTCTGVSGCGASVSSVTLGAGASTGVSVSYTAGQGGSSGTVALRATQTDNAGTTDTGSISVSVARTYGVAVTPDGTAVTGSAQEAKTQTFTVKNNGNASASFSLQVSSCTGATGCGASADSVTLAAGASQSVTVSYTLGAGGSSGTVALRATQTDNAGTTDTGSISISVPAILAITVTPWDTSATVVAGSSQSEEFDVRNTGNISATFDISRICTGAAVQNCAGLLPPIATLEPGEQFLLLVSYTAGAPGTSGTIAIQATHTTDASVTATGTVSVGVSSPTGAVAPTLAFAPHMQDRGEVIRRDLCVTASAGAGAAMECGDLRLAHALPTVSTLNKARTPVLLYNSAHAEPVFRVAADVTRPASSGAPDYVKASLYVGGVEWASRNYAGSEWSAGETRRITLGFDATDLETGVHAYELHVDFYYSGYPYTQTLSGEQIVVNRSESYFGAGWWLAGLERIHFPQNDTTTRLLVGGDGSALVYRKVTADRWAGPLVDGRADTLYHVPSDNGYYRRLDRVGKVRFVADGRHVYTQNRLDHVTRFVYVVDASYGERLTYIRAPVSTGWGNDTITHRFHYDGLTSPRTGWRLREVLSPAGRAGDADRMVSFAYVHGDWRTTRITDPDGSSVAFAYHDAPFLSLTPNRVLSRTDRRGVETAFSYDYAELGTLTRAGLALESGDSLATVFRAAESLGGQVSVALADAWAEIDGARTDVPDVTRFRVGRFGMPRTVVNALGDSTTVVSVDSRFPALPTEVVDPTGLRSLAAYDARGNVTSSTLVDPLGDGRNAVSQYRYTDPNWPDFPTRTVAPEGDSTVVAYDTATGNRIWQQPGADQTRRAEFRYNALGLIEAVLSPSQRADPTLGFPTFHYDADGNVYKTVSPTGVLTLAFKDQIGRDTLVVTPVDDATAYDSTALVGGGARVRTVYDAMGRVTQTESWGPTTNFQYSDRVAGVMANGVAPEKRLVVVNDYDVGGLLEHVARWSEPDSAGVGAVHTWWEFDRAGRTVREATLHATGPSHMATIDTAATVTEYAPSGAWVRTTSPRGHTVTVEYDTLGRVARRIVPGVSVPMEWYDGNDYVEGQHSIWYFPFLGAGSDGRLTEYNTGTYGLEIPADTARFTYDAAGRILTASNRDAVVEREYLPGGALEAETQKIRTWVGQDFTRHVYRLENAYDLNGRRTRLTLPDSVVEGVPWMKHTYYAYDPVTGALSTVSDTTGLAGRQQLYTYVYDVDGALEELQLSAGYAGVTEEYTYDREGRMETRHQWRGSAPVHADTFTYDPRGKMLRIGALGDSTVHVYDGLGAAVRSYTDVYVNQTDPEEIHLRDALGNAYRSWRETYSTETDLLVSGTTEQVYHAGTGQLSGSAEYGVYQQSTNAWLSGDEFRYDASGNQEATARNRNAYSELTRNYYGADEKLRVVDHRTCPVVTMVEGGGVGFPSTTYRCGALQHTDAPSFEEYRYDALGRRVWQRVVQDTTLDRGACSVRCAGAVARTVWDGDRIVAEIRAHHSEPERETGFAGMLVPSETPGQQNFVLAAGADEPLYGRVVYTFGSALDHPLSLVRLDYDTIFSEPLVVLPHTDWKGNYDGGTWASTGTATGPCTTISYAQPGDFDPWQEEETEPGMDPNDPRTMEVCAEVYWPADHLWQTHKWRSGRGGPKSWSGSLVLNKRELTGQLYMRNRYYDSETGRFTQEDPIGLAGGLNLYGFAAGDPVNYSDPYGLCPPINECLAGGGPTRWITVLSMSKGQTRRIGSTELTALSETSVRMGLDSNGQAIVFLAGRVRISDPHLPAATKYVPISYLALNLDSGEFDLYGRAGLNVVAAWVQGNARTGEYEGRVCVAWAYCHEITDKSEQAEEVEEDDDSEATLILTLPIGAENVQ